MRERGCGCGDEYLLLNCNLDREPHFLLWRSIYGGDYHVKKNDSIL